jgi:hypothetical protein
MMIVSSNIYEINLHDFLEKRVGLLSRLRHVNRKSKLLSMQVSIRVYIYIYIYILIERSLFIILLAIRCLSFFNGCQLVGYLPLVSLSHFLRLINLI